MLLQLNFCIELECFGSRGTGIFRSIFVYASTDAQVRQQQWNYFVNKRPRWGENWFLGGDFNDIRQQDEKKGGRRRVESSFQAFNSSINQMGMAEGKSIRALYTWANNKQREGYVEEKLDSFFGAAS